MIGDLLSIASEEEPGTSHLLSIVTAILRSPKASEPPDRPERRKASGEEPRLRRPERDERAGNGERSTQDGIFRAPIASTRPELSTVPPILRSMRLPLAEFSTLLSPLQAVKCINPIGSLLAETRAPACEPADRVDHR